MLQPGNTNTKNRQSDRGQKNKPGNARKAKNGKLGCAEEHGRLAETHMHLTGRIYRSPVPGTHPQTANRRKAFRSCPKSSDSGSETRVARPRSNAQECCPTVSDRNRAPPRTRAGDTVWQEGSAWRPKLSGQKPLRRNRNYVKIEIRKSPRPEFTW